MLALGAKTAMMNIVGTVAAETSLTCFVLLHLLGMVTVVTAHADMRAVQSKACFVMIKIPTLPGSGVMTGLAFVAVSLMVFILFLMAGITGRGRVMEGRGLMAIFTCRPGVTAGQWKVRFIVIIRCVLPGFLVMAGSALPAELLLMFIIF